MTPTKLITCKMFISFTDQNDPALNVLSKCMWSSVKPGTPNENNPELGGPTTDGMEYLQWSLSICVHGNLQFPNKVL